MDDMKLIFFFEERDSSAGLALGCWTRQRASELSQVSSNDGSISFACSKPPLTNHLA